MCRWILLTTRRIAGCGLCVSLRCKDLIIARDELDEESTERIIGAQRTQVLHNILSKQAHRARGEGGWHACRQICNAQEVATEVVVDMKHKGFRRKERGGDLKQGDTKGTHATRRMCSNGSVEEKGKEGMGREEGQGPK